jgi:NADH-quinone oxidoreductase subunit L
MTSSNLVYLIALPLLSSAFLMLLGRKADKWGHIFATLISASTFGIGAMEFLAMRDRPEEMRAVTQLAHSMLTLACFLISYRSLLFYSLLALER